jgi:hypothetical protein
VQTTEENTEAQATENKGTDEKVAMAPDVQEKFNKIYKEAKTAKERAALLEAHTLKLQEATARLQNRLDEAEKRDAVADLKSQLRTARDQGDDDAVEKLQDKLTEIMVEAKLEKKIKPAQQQQVQQQDMQQAALQLSQSESRITTKWANEVDDDGEYLRPWAVTDTHPKSAVAADYLADLLQNEEYADLTIKEKLALVDEKYGRKTQVKRNVNAVGEGSLTKATEKTDIKLTPDEQRVAYRMFSKLSKGEAEKAYLEGKKLTGGK